MKIYGFVRGNQYGEVKVGRKELEVERLTKMKF